MSNLAILHSPMLWRMQCHLILNHLLFKNPFHFFWLNIFVRFYFYSTFYCFLLNVNNWVSLLYMIYFLPFLFLVFLFIYHLIIFWNDWQLWIIKNLAVFLGFFIWMQEIECIYTDVSICKCVYFQIKNIYINIGTYRYKRMLKSS